MGRGGREDVTSVVGRAMVTSGELLIREEAKASFGRPCGWFEIRRPKFGRKTAQSSTCSMTGCEASREFEECRYLFRTSLNDKCAGRTMSSNRFVSGLRKYLLTHLPRYRVPSRIPPRQYYLDHSDHLPPRHSLSPLHAQANVASTEAPPSPHPSAATKPASVLPHLTPK